MGKTVGCTDFNQECCFRITAEDGQEDMMVDVATAHAIDRHRELVADEQAFRSSVRSQIKGLMRQAKMSEREIAEALG
jgi:predicted XRE-type DNA-binding protein